MVLVTPPVVLFAPRKRGVRIPQADELDKVIQVVERAGLGVHDSKGLANLMGFNPRQSSYYREAAEILGFLNPSKKYYLTDIGRQLLVSDQQKRARLMSAALIRYPVISAILACLQSGISEEVSRKDITALVVAIRHLDQTTAERRAQTIMSWIRWLQTNIGIVEVEEGGVTLAKQEKLGTF